MKMQMMAKPVRAILGLVLFALTTIGFAIVLYGSAAQAQEAPVILVVNNTLLLVDSDAGKNIAEQAEALQTTIAKELQTEFDAIKAEEETLIAQQTLLAPDVLRGRAEKLQVKRQNFQINRQIKSREFQQSVAQARQKIALAVEPILEAIIEERSATILLDRSNIVFASTDIDITAEVMKRLNDKLKSVKLERIKVEVPAPAGD